MACRIADISVNDDSAVVHSIADSVLRSADKALVASINEVRDARQKISDTYKGEKNPQ